jgi:hypothetical protein
VAGFFVRGRMGGMKSISTSIVILAGADFSWEYIGPMLVMVLPLAGIAIYIAVSMIRERWGKK